MKKFIKSKSHQGGEKTQTNERTTAPPPQSSLSALWTRKEVADALHLCVHSVARYTKRGLLPCITINRRVMRYDPAVVQAFIQRAQGATQ